MNKGTFTKSNPKRFLLPVYNAYIFNHEELMRENGLSCIFLSDLEGIQVAVPLKNMGSFY